MVGLVLELVPKPQGYTDLLDSSGTFFAVAKVAGLTDAPWQPAPGAPEHGILGRRTLDDGPMGVCEKSTL